MNQQNEGPLLELIRQHELSPRQKALRPAQYLEELSMYKFRREPTRLDEFEWENLRGAAIWRENGSIIFICNQSYKPFWKRNLVLKLDHVGPYHPRCIIYGETDPAIAETATFLGSLKHSSADKAAALQLCCERTSESAFDFSSLQGYQFAQILDSNPERRIKLDAVVSAEQSQVSASRPYPLNLTLFGDAIAFLDYGAALVDELEKRRCIFGSLLILGGTESVCLSSGNLKRLLEVEYVFDELTIRSSSKECALLPFSAKVNALHYIMIDTEHIQPRNFDCLDIATKDLTVTMFMKKDDEWDALLISFLNRVAQLGHLEKFRFTTYFPDILVEYDDVARVAAALARAIRANPKLSCLDLSYNGSYLCWGPHLQTVFASMEEHKGLRTLIVQSYLLDDLGDEEEPEDEDEKFEHRFAFDRSWLERLLSRNRNIEVIDCSGTRVSNGSTIDKLYALNYFYNGSTALGKESTYLRPLLMATALTESAAEKFQYTALLLSHHTDMLCEFVNGMNQEVTVSSSASCRSKRKPPTRPSRDAKKAARDEP